MFTHRNIIICLMILMAAYFFVSCEEIDPCNPNPCQNGGTCTDTGSIAECVCIDGYTGPTCEVPPDPCIGVDCGEQGTCVDGICECYAGYEGDNCETEINECIPEPCLNGGVCTDLIADYECACIGGYHGDNCEMPPIPFNEIAADRLDPTGCETYIGAHPVNPGEILCCSNSFPPNVAPECNPAVDTPDIPRVVEFEFCDDGTASKAMSPDPASGMFGHSISTSGSWTVDTVTGELEIITESSSMGGLMIQIESYPLAFTYDSGTKLDLYSSAAVTIDEYGIGDYRRVVTSYVIIGGLWDAILDTEIITDVTVNSTGYDSTSEKIIDCDPAGSMVCQAVPASEVIFASGTHTHPIDLYVTPAGWRMYQTDESEAIVFELQPDSCEGIDCGAYGSCDNGVCVCTDGYSGEFCDVPGSCAGIDCGANGTCVAGICECDTGYEGDNCEVDINECNPNPCQNGGACAEGVPGTYECTCIGGYTGDSCEEPWTCYPSYYGGSDGCDCGCGSIDPDCSDQTVSSCDSCAAMGSCAEGLDCSIIHPTNNGICQ